MSVYSIYKLCCIDDAVCDKIYTGSTENFEKRHMKHRTNCINPKNDRYNLKVYNI